MLVLFNVLGFCRVLRSGCLLCGDLPSESVCAILNRLRLVCRALEEGLRRYPCYGCQHLDRVRAENLALCRALHVSAPIHLPDTLEELSCNSDLSWLPPAHPKLQRLRCVSGAQERAPIPDYITQMWLYGLPRRHFWSPGSQLRWLALQSTPCYIQFMIEPDMLPPSLQHLELNGYGVARLPDHLESLTLVHCILSFLDHMPANLIWCEFILCVPALPALNPSDWTDSKARQSSNCFLLRRNVLKPHQDAAVISRALPLQVTSGLSQCQGDDASPCSQESCRPA